MTENILLNPTEHPAGTEFVHRVGDYLIGDKITKWSESGLLQIKSCGSGYWVFPAEVEVLKILPVSPTSSASVDFAELVAACRALDAELPDQHENAAINAALRRRSAAPAGQTTTPGPGWRSPASD